MPRGFEPTRAARAAREKARHGKGHLSKDWRQPAPAGNPNSPPSQHGISPNYRGDPTVISNQSADIPNSMNTSLWVTRIPHECTCYDLMETLRGRGKILQSGITRDSSLYRDAAARITFFRHEDAENVKRAFNNGSLRMHLPQAGKGGKGFKLRACWNRVRVPEWKLEKRPGNACLPSRVVRVYGSEENVAPGAMQKYFSSVFCFELDRMIPLGTDVDGRVGYEYRFASWQNQADFAFMAVARDKPMIKIEWGEDPCEVNPNESNGEGQKEDGHKNNAQSMRHSCSVSCLVGLIPVQ
ncbi:hypothetical protein F5Y12DRAFT_721240 [Xylaria sp. FL1777]|nr:hypothetical protein F5Y12DRAFT_721240 [Xylaria sp. FL1777]